MNQNVDIMIRGYKDKIREMQELIEHLQTLNKKYEETIVKFGAEINSVEIPEYSWDVGRFNNNPMKIITHREIQFPRVVLAFRSTQDHINKLIGEALVFKTD